MNKILILPLYGNDNNHIIDMKTQPAQITMGSQPTYRTRPLELLEKDIYGKITNKLSLENVQEVYLVGSDVLVPMSEGFRKLSTTKNPVAFIAGDMLDADNAWFHIIFLGLSGEPSGATRYKAVKGIDNAQKAVVNWSRRSFRQQKD